MKKEKPPVTYDTRYRYKLDMLEPGTIMLKWVGIFLLIGLALELLRWKLAAAIAFGFSGALCGSAGFPRKSSGRCCPSSFRQ